MDEVEVVANYSTLLHWKMISFGKSGSGGGGDGGSVN